MSDRHALIAYLSTLLAIVGLVIIGAYLVAQGKDIAALGVAGGVTGLIGVAGTFKPRTGGVSDQAMQSAVDKIPPVTTDGAKTDPAAPAG